MHINLDAWGTDPGFICAIALVTVAQRAKEESDITEGPFRFTDESMELIASALAEYSKSSKFRMEFISMQAALDVVWEVEARDVRSQTRCQASLKELESTPGLPAILLRASISLFHMGGNRFMDWGRGRKQKNTLQSPPLSKMILRRYRQVHRELNAGAMIPSIPCSHYAE